VRLSPGETTFFAVPSSNLETIPGQLMLFAVPILAAVTFAGQSPDHAAGAPPAPPAAAVPRTVAATRAA